MTDQTTDGGIVAPLAFDVAARLAEIDQKRLRAYRLARLRAELARRDYMGCLLAEPINIRYATGSRNMQIWTLHAPGRWAFVPTQGPITLYEFTSSMHVNDGIETIAELKPTIPWFYFLAGPRAEGSMRRSRSSSRAPSSRPRSWPRSGWRWMSAMPRSGACARRSGRASPRTSSGR